MFKKGQAQPKLLPKQANIHETDFLCDGHCSGRSTIRGERKSLSANHLVGTMVGNNSKWCQNNQRTHERCRLRLWKKNKFQQRKWMNKDQICCSWSTFHTIKRKCGFRFAFIILDVYHISITFWDRLRTSANVNGLIGGKGKDGGRRSNKLPKESIE